MTDTDDTTAGWANGVTLKRTNAGYSWTIAVASSSDELDAMRAAAATARRIDDELTATYGPPRERGASPRVHAPPRDDDEEAF